MQVIEPPAQRHPTPTGSAILALGFRPFFALAGLFSMLAISAWGAVYLAGLGLLTAELPAAHWHGHEMIFGYAMAVVAGFLLTAVGNWTGLITLRGRPLAGLVAMWLTARTALLLPGETALMTAASADLLFAVDLLIATGLPVWRQRQWQQLGILSVVLLLLVANGVFYAGAFGVLDQGVVWGLHGGLYLLVALIFAMGRRVIPMFIERGVNETLVLRNRAWVDHSGLLLFLVWMALELFADIPLLASGVATSLLVIHGIRMRDWYTPRIWRKPLLWSLYLGYGFVLLGFALNAVAPWQPLAGVLALHAFAYGGVGMVTLGMMARVALGHTGRNVFQPPTALAVLFGMVLTGALVRVIPPLVWPGHYLLWIGLAQLLWIAAFAGFTWLYLPICWRPRIDGRPG